MRKRPSPEWLSRQISVSIAEAAAYGLTRDATRWYFIECCATDGNMSKRLEPNTKIKFRLQRLKWLKREAKSLDMQLLPT